MSTAMAMKSGIEIQENLEPPQVVEKLLQTGSCHLLQKNKKYFDEDLNRANDFLTTPMKYFNTPGAGLITSIEKKLEVPFSSPIDKAGMKQKTCQFVEALNIQNVTESAEAIIEELYMNSMLDAPREAAKLGQTNCSYEVGLYSTLRLHLSADRLVISCEDPFGSLNIKRFVARMAEVYQKGAGQAMNMESQSGAGLGCVIMFEHSETMYLGVIPGQKTLVSCVIPVGMSYRQRSQVKKNLHLILI